MTISVCKRCNHVAGAEEYEIPECCKEGHLFEKFDVPRETAKFIEECGCLEWHAPQSQSVTN